MFNLDQAIDEWRRQMASDAIKDSKVLDELESHLREDVEQQIHLGLSAQAAFEVAVQRIGQASELKAEFAKVGGTRPTPRARLVSIGGFVSAVFLVVVGTWTIMEFETSPAKRIFGLSVIWLIALYSGSLPFMYQWLPSTQNAGAKGTFKALSIVVYLWVFLAFLSAVQIVHLEVGITLSTIMWALCAAYAATVFAGMAGIQDEDAELAATLATFTPVAKQSLEFAHEEASRLCHDFIGTEHALLGLLKLEESAVRNVLGKMGINCEIVMVEIEKQVGLGFVHPATAALPMCRCGAMRKKSPCTPRLKKALRLAAREAKAMNHSGVSSEHILLGLLLEGDGVAARVLRHLDINPETARKEISKELDP